MANRTRKPAAQLDREIKSFLEAAKRRPSHVSKRPPSLQDQIVDLLMQNTDEARHVTRDLLLDRGVIKTGRIAQLNFIGEDFPGDIYQVLLSDDNKRYWTAIPRTKPLLRVGDVVDYAFFRKNSPGLVSVGDEAHPKYQLRVVEFPEGASSDAIRAWLTHGHTPLLDAAGFAHKRDAAG